MIRLLTVGDSFTYGEELEDINLSWPFILNKQLGYEVTNLAKPGSGNTRMVRHCVEKINEYDIVIIAWSHFARIEMADEGGFYDLWPGCSSAPHHKYSPWRKEVIEYIHHHHNDTYLYRQYLLNIILLQNYLQTHNKRYLMLDSFGNHQKIFRTQGFNSDLIDQIDKSYYIGWPEHSMMEWTYGCPQGPGGHFLEQGHAVVAEKIYEFMEQLNWLD